MAGKRSRISQSRSFGNRTTGVMLNRRPIRDQQQQRWESQFSEISTAASASDHSPPGIFALCSSIAPPLPLSPPIMMTARKSERADPAAHFLDRCCYCKKRLDHNKDIYMYGRVLCILYI
ncbi:hypothetical protein LINPERPRIM_LOCUS14065 [Linum perenne]